MLLFSVVFFFSTKSFSCTYAQVCQGGKVPESYYISEDAEELEHMSVAHVAHGEKLRLQYAVKETDCIVR